MFVLPVYYFAVQDYRDNIDKNIFVTSNVDRLTRSVLPKKTPRLKMF